MTKNKDLLTLLMALSLPVLLIIVLVTYLYLPSYFIKPKTNFIYYTSSYAPNNVIYTVLNDHLTFRPPQYSGNSDKSTSQQNYQWPEIYLYNVATHQKQKISFNEAQKYNLSIEEKSPDGFEIVSGTGGGGFFPFDYSSSDYYSRYLKKNGYSKKLNLDLSNSNNNFIFLGWVVD